MAPAERAFLATDWPMWARADQLPPAGDWTTWLMLGGRGAGKTRAGAEWCRAVALADPAARIALVGETLHEARAVMVEGPSGLLACHADAGRPLWHTSRRELVWPGGARAQVFSADDPEALRGAQFSAAWCDEIAKWRRGEAAWDMLQFGLRLGAAPRQVATTTPRATPLLKRLLADPRCATTRATTADNAAHLAPTFLSAVVGRYAGTRLGRQELDGELIEDREDGLFRRAEIEAARRSAAPELTRIVVAIDPPVTSGARADACGIVAAGRCAAGRAYVLADATVSGARPQEWARCAVRLFERVAADRMVAEVNQGGELVAELLRQIAPGLPLRLVHASRGKVARAEPVAALYERGLVAHVGALPALEDEMCDFGHAGLSGGRSPDRVDALVWALTELMLQDDAAPRIRAL